VGQWVMAEMSQQIWVLMTTRILLRQSWWSVVSERRTQTSASVAVVAVVTFALVTARRVDTFGVDVTTLHVHTFVYVYKRTQIHVHKHTQTHTHTHTHIIISITTSGLWSYYLLGLYRLANRHWEYCTNHSAKYEYRYE